MNATLDPPRPPRDRQILVSLPVNSVIIWGAGGFAAWMGRRPSWAAFQRWLMATELGALAVRLALERRPS